MINRISDSGSDSSVSRLSVAELKSFVPRALHTVGMPKEDAEITAQALIDSSLRGVDSHGIEKLVMYLGLFERGAVDPAPTIAVDDPDGPTATIDAGHGLGFVPSVRAADLAAEKAATYGVGAVAVRSSGHFGAGGYYVKRIADTGAVGFISTNARPLMPCDGGATALVGNNPFAFAAPRADGPPFVFDMACSVSAFGNIRRAIAAGDPVPEDWGFGRTGEPTQDPNEILQAGLLAPIGGYKGFNLALTIEILSAALCGAAMGPNAGSVGEPNTQGCGHFVLALEPRWFGAGNSAATVHDWLEAMREQAPQLRIPGETGERRRQERLQRGIPVPESIAVRFDEIQRQMPPTAGQTVVP